MIVLMGGRYSQGYALFVQLTVKAFLAIRPHAEQLIETVHLMLGTGLPSFKGEPTIRRLRDRFVLGMAERQAGEWMMSVIKNAHENYRSTVYDEFQRVSKCLTLWLIHIAKLCDVGWPRFQVQNGEHSCSRWFNLNSLDLNPGIPYA